MTYSEVLVLLDQSVQTDRTSTVHKIETGTDGSIHEVYFIVRYDLGPT